MSRFVQGNAEIVLNSTGHWWNEYGVAILFYGKP